MTVPPAMRAWAVGEPGPVDSGPLVSVQRPVPQPAPGEIRVRVRRMGRGRRGLRLPAARRDAVELEVASAGPSDGRPPEPLDSAILFAPAGDLVPVALEALERGGTLALAGIHLSPVPPLDYQRHLFQERQVRRVTANTRADGEEFLTLAGRLGLQVTTQPYPLDRAADALADLAHDRVTGAAVLTV